MKPAAVLFILLLVCTADNAWGDYVTNSVAYANDYCQSDVCGTVSNCFGPEFAARAIAAGSCLPGLSSSSPQISYYGFSPFGGPYVLSFSPLLSSFPASLTASRTVTFTTLLGRSNMMFTPMACSTTLHAPVGRTRVLTRSSHLRPAV